MGCGVKDMMERKQSIHVWTNMVFHFNFYSHKYVSKWGLERDVFPPPTNLMAYMFPTMSGCQMGMMAFP